MTIPAAAEGQGTTLTFGTFAANVRSIDGPSFKRAGIDSTHLGSVDTMESIPAKLVDPGEISMEVEFDPAALPPIQDDPASLAIVWASETPSTWTWTNAYFTSFKTGAKTGALLVASVTIKLNGLPSIT